MDLFRVKHTPQTECGTSQKMSCCCLVTKHVLLFVTSWVTACQGSLPFTISWSLLKLMPIEPVMLSNHLIIYCPLLHLPSIFLSIRVFSNESALYIRWPMYWSFSFSTSPSSEYSGLIFFRFDWLDLLAVHGTIKNTGVGCHALLQGIFPTQG